MFGRKDLECSLRKDVDYPRRNKKDLKRSGRCDRDLECSSTFWYHIVCVTERHTYI
jgi:hypothetical protein